MLHNDGKHTQWFMQCQAICLMNNFKCKLHRQAKQLMMTDTDIGDWD